MTELKRLAMIPEFEFAKNPGILAYNVDNLVILARLKFPGQPLTVEMVLSCLNFEARESHVLSQAIAVKLNALGIATETNEKVVSMEAVISFVSGLKLKFGVAQDQVLARLQTSLTPEKLKNLMYFQDNGHELDVTGITGAGELEFDTCSIESPQGDHRNKNYFQALELATGNGATLMTTEKYKWFRTLTPQIIFDQRTWSWLLSPNAGTPVYPRFASIGDGGLVDDFNLPTYFNSHGAFRVSLRV